MKTIRYKGYVGEYAKYYDGKDTSCYYAGEIPAVEQHAKVLFEGENIEELTEDFHAAVEDCIANGYAPKEKSHRISIPESLYAILISRAKKEGVSVSHYVSHALSSIVL